MNGNGAAPGTVMALLQGTKNWVEQPFVGTVSLSHLAIAAIVVASALFLWSRVLAHIGE